MKSGLAVGELERFFRGLHERTVTERLARLVLSGHGLSADDRDSEAYKALLREPIYETLFDVASDNLERRLVDLGKETFAFMAKLSFSASSLAVATRLWASPASDIEPTNGRAVPYHPRRGKDGFHP